MYITTLPRASRSPGLAAFRGLWRCGGAGMGCAGCRRPCGRGLGEDLTPPISIWGSDQPPTSLPGTVPDLPRPQFPAQSTAHPIIVAPNYPAPAPLPAPPISAGVSVPLSLPGTVPALAPPSGLTSFLAGNTMGVSNTYWVAGLVGVGVLAAVSGGKRRRR